MNKSSQSIEVYPNRLYLKYVDLVLPPNVPKEWIEKTRHQADQGIV